MKITLEFSEHELRTMISEHVKRESLVPPGNYVAVSFKKTANDVIAHVEIQPLAASGDYRDR